MSNTPVSAVKKIAKKYEEINELSLTVNRALEAKYGDVSLQYNVSDGLVLLFDDEHNAAVDHEDIRLLLDKDTSIEDGFEYMRSKSC